MNLDLESASEDNYWPTFSDVALSLLLVFTLFVLAQFLYYDKVLILEVIDQRQHEVAALIRERVPAEYGGSVVVDQLDNYRQRVTFVADSLFASCQAELKGRGAELVATLSAILADRQDYFQSVQVEGHTDSRPPAGPPSCPVQDNWMLSSLRATEVVRLFGRSPIRPELLSAVGRGQFHPINPEDHGRNRRIEVVLQYSERGILDAQ